LLRGRYGSQAQHYSTGPTLLLCGQSWAEEDLSRKTSSFLPATFFAEVPMTWWPSAHRHFD